MNASKISLALISPFELNRLSLKLFIQASLDFFNRNTFNLRRLLVIASAVLIYRNSAKIPSRKASPKGGPLWLPVIGHGYLFGDMLRSPLMFWLRLMSQCGFETVELTFPDNLNLMILMDERDRKYVLKDSWQNFQRNYDESLGFNLSFDELFGRSVFTTEGDEWKFHRKMVSPMFTNRYISVTMAKVFAEYADMFKQALERKANAGETFDLQLLLQSLVLDAFCTLAFGVSPESFKQAEKRKKSEFQEAFDFVQGVCTQRFVTLPTLGKVARTCKIGVEAGMPAALKTVNDFIYKIVRQRLKLLESCPTPEAQADDILGMYFRIALKKNRPDLLEEKHIRDVMVTFMLAGRDSTSYQLTNAFALLSEDSGLERKLATDCHQRLRQGSMQFALEGLEEFVLGDAVFYEALRMFPPSNFDLRYCMTDDVLPSGIPIKAGCAATISTFAIARNPKYFEDPDQFKPERWLVEDEVEGKLVCKTLDQYKYPFFWGGKHACLGKHMTRVETKIFLGIILDRLKLSMAKPRKLEFLPGIVKFYKEGVIMKAERRR